MNLLYCPRQRHLEPRPALPAVLRPDSPAVALDDRLGDRQSQARVAVTGVGLAGTVGEEAVEDAVQVGLGNARAGVVDADGGGAVAPFQGDGHGAAGGGEAAGVVEQVLEDLVETLGSPADGD